jgi:hypothetical protein
MSEEESQGAERHCVEERGGGNSVAESHSDATLFELESKEFVERICGTSRHAISVARMPRWLHRAGGTSLVPHYKLGGRGA